MATIKQYGGVGFASNWASIILESDAEAAVLPISTIDTTKLPSKIMTDFLLAVKHFAQVRVMLLCLQSLVGLSSKGVVLWI